MNIKSKLEIARILSKIRGLTVFFLQKSKLFVDICTSH
jgi:hypothetical protein